MITQSTTKSQSDKSRKALLFYAIVVLFGGASIYSSLQQSTIPIDFFEFDIPTIQSKTADGVQHLWGSLGSTTGFNGGRKPTNLGLPTLEELTRVNYTCPNGTEFFENIVLPESITHANRRIPKVVHVTAKTRCVTPNVKNHLQRWVFPDHSLYFHDDVAAYRLLQYVTKDANGHELVRGLYKQLLCISSGATMSDMWRYILLYHYGGIYTDLDNAPGPKYDVELITPEMDSFYLVEVSGFISQYFMVSSKHHPMLLYVIKHAIEKLYNKPRGNVMTNFPILITGPGAVKDGYINFIRNAGGNTTGYDPAGIYYGSAGEDLLGDLSWFGKGSEELDIATLGEYSSPAEFENRSVTIVGTKQSSILYVNRYGLPDKDGSFGSMNMSHYRKDKHGKPKVNKISCPHHSERMMNQTNDPSSFYYHKNKIQDLLPKYEFRPAEQHYFDTNTGEQVDPWTEEQKEEFNFEEMVSSF